MEHLVIIGNGITGVTVARHVRKRSKMKITMISGETDHFFSRTALMYIYMGDMKYEHTKPYENWFWSKNNINLMRDVVTDIDTENNRIRLESHNTMEYDKLVIVTGSSSNKFGWPGQDLPGVQGLYSYQDLELLEENTANIERAVIVGGGLIGFEMAEMLISRKISVTFLVREKNCWDIILPEEEAKMINLHIIEHGIDLHLSTELKEIISGPEGRVAGIITKEDDHIPCQFVGLTVGVHPNIEFLKKSKIETNYGLLVNDYLETNIANVYAAGDCAEILATDPAKQNRVEQLWYTGRMQGEALAKTICGERTKYERGIWFNSAKFFDIEYQTYGFVSNNPRDGEKSFYWENEEQKCCIRFVYNTESRAINGINVFGMRLSQNVCQNWIQEKRKIDYVIEHLDQAHFDPEFNARFYDQISDQYARQNQSEIAEALERRGKDGR
jgi:NAD(P)H-nitrite reductase large subunit